MDTLKQIQDIPLFQALSNKVLEALSRALRRMLNNGMTYVYVQGRMITILDYNALEELSEWE
jgi:hypothetical protein